MYRHTRMIPVWCVRILGGDWKMSLHDIEDAMPLPDLRMSIALVEVPVDFGDDGFEEHQLESLRWELNDLNREESPAQERWIKGRVHRFLCVRCRSAIRPGTGREHLLQFRGAYRGNAPTWCGEECRDAAEVERGIARADAQGWLT